MAPRPKLRQAGDQTDDDAEQEPFADVFEVPDEPAQSSAGLCGDAFRIDLG